MKSRISLVLISALQGCTIIFAVSSICGKLASRYDFLSGTYLLWFFLELLFLGIYAVLWQQIIKKVDISIAYANKATVIFWSMLFAFVIFSEKITLMNIIGVILIFMGIVMVNRND